MGHLEAALGIFPLLPADSANVYKDEQKGRSSTGLRAEEGIPKDSPTLKPRERPLAARMRSGKE